MAAIFLESNLNLMNDLRSEVFNRAKNSSIAHIILMIIYFLISKDFKSFNFSFFIGLICISLNLIRLYCSYDYSIHKIISNEIKIGHDIGAIGSGLCWGSLLIYSYLNFGLFHPSSLALYVIISGVAGGAVGSLSSELKILYSFLFFVLFIPGFVILVHEPIFENKLFGLLLIIYTLFLSVQSRQSQENLIAKIKMGYFLINEKERIEGLFNSIPGITAFVDLIDNITISNLEWKKIYPQNIRLYEVDYKLGDIIYGFKQSEQTDLSLETELGEHFQFEIYLINMRKINKSNEMIISLINITENKKVLFEIQRHKDSIQHNARMIELGEMVGGVAHEINNPLSVAVGKIFLAKMMMFKEHLDQGKLFKYLEETEIAFDRISKIVQRMKSISRKSEDDPMKLETLESILDVVFLMTSIKIKEKEIRFNFDDHGLKHSEILCRASQIEQVLINLINNSIDAIENLPEKWIRLELRNKDNKIDIIITDSGLGIPEEARDGIWNSFYTTKEAGKGTGLGLSISKQIIESHMGTITINPECKNTQFIIELLIKE